MTTTGTTAPTQLQRIAALTTTAVPRRPRTARRVRLAWEWSALRKAVGR